MSIINFFLLLVASLCVQILSAQESVEMTWQRLEKAMMEKDTVTLRSVLHEDLTYGHSNGWTETKKEMIQNLVSGKMQYSLIVSQSPVWKQTGDVVTLKTQSEIAYVVNGKEGQLKLFVVQVWKKENETWKLLVRQSTKLN